MGTLSPGSNWKLIGSVPNWHEVRLPNGVQGFVSKRWTVVVPTTTPPAPPPAVAALYVEVFAYRLAVHST